MGSFGALYYATRLQPAAVIVGKPLINVGTIANNMKLVRPNDFGTSLDVLRSNEGGISENEINQLDQNFGIKYTTVNSPRQHLRLHIWSTMIMISMPFMNYYQYLQNNMRV